MVPAVSLGAGWPGRRAETDPFHHAPGTLTSPSPRRPRCSHPCRAARAQGHGARETRDAMEPSHIALETWDSLWVSHMICRVRPGGKDVGAVHRGIPGGPGSARLARPLSCRARASAGGRTRRLRCFREGAAEPALAAAEGSAEAGAQSCCAEAPSRLAPAPSSRFKKESTRRRRALRPNHLTFQ